MNKKRILVFAALHFAALAATFTLSFSSQMARFEDGSPATAFDSALSSIVNILATPMVWFWNSSISGAMGTMMEWLMIGLNSLIWGCLIEVIYRQFRQTRPSAADRAGE